MHPSIWRRTFVRVICKNALFPWLRHQGYRPFDRPSRDELVVQGRVEAAQDEQEENLHAQGDTDEG